MTASKPSAVRHLLVALLAAMMTTPTAMAACNPAPGLDRFFTQGWGFDPSNARYVSADTTSITADTVGRLKLKWAFALGKPGSPHSYPLVTEDTVFIGSHDGLLYALDKESGCLRWIRQVDSDIRTAIVHTRATVRGAEQVLLLFGTEEGGVYAVAAQNGDVIWRVQADVHQFTRITGTPTAHQGRVYVGVSSIEAGIAAGPTYGCCTFRGSILSLDAATGKRVWRSYTIDEPARVIDTHYLMIKEKGPSGAPVWSAPTIDSKRSRLYYGTGENYSDPATTTSDAIIALDLGTGEKQWVHQFTKGDAWNISCELPFLSSNCPDVEGVDLDFGAPPILAVGKEGRELLLAGQKSGMVYAMNPDDGALVWEKRVGRGGKLGGIHWGMAVNPERGILFVAVSDRVADSEDPGDAAAYPGLHALDMVDGKVLWTASHADTCGGKKNCYPGVSAAVLATQDLVFTGALDGHVRAHRADNGEVVWSFDTWRSFDSVNALPTEGGTIDVHGPLVVGDMLFVTSGYDSFAQKAGNAFLAFGLEGGQ